MESPNQHWQFYAGLWGTPLALAFFVAGLVREMKIYDDRAFHRTLPISHGGVYWRLIRPVAWAFLVATVLTIGGGLWVNAPVISIALRILNGLGPLFLPLGIVGILFTLGSRRSYSKITDWVMVMLAFCAGHFLFPFFMGLSPQLRPLYMLIIGGAMSWGAGVLLLPIWWLAAGGRNRGWVVGLATVVGLLQAGFFNCDLLARDDQFGGRAPWQGHGPDRQDITVLRKKRLLSASEPPVPLEDLLEVRGLKPGEMLCCSDVEVGASQSFMADLVIGRIANELKFVSFHNRTAGSGVLIYGTLDVALKEDGSRVWGYAAQAAMLQSRLPSGLEIRNTVEFPAGALSVPAGESIYPKRKWKSYADAVNKQAWLTFAFVQRAADVLTLDLSQAHSQRLETGGILSLTPLREQDGEWQLQVRTKALSPMIYGWGWFPMKAVKEMRGKPSRMILVNEKAGLGYLVDNSSVVTEYQNGLMGTEVVQKVHFYPAEGTPPPSPDWKLCLVRLEVESLPQLTLHPPK